MPRVPPLLERRGARFFSLLYLLFFLDAPEVYIIFLLRGAPYGTLLDIFTDGIFPAASSVGFRPKEFTF